MRIKLNCNVAIILSFSWHIIGVGTCNAQVNKSSVDSMLKYGNSGDWKSAQKWAITSAESDSLHRTHFYYKAAEYASNDRDAKSAMDHLEIAIKYRKGDQVDLGNSQFSWLHSYPRWFYIVNLTKPRKPAPVRDRAKTLAAAELARKIHGDLLKTAKEEDAVIISEKDPALLYKKIQSHRHTATSEVKSTFQYAWCRINDSIDVPYMVQLPKNYDFRKKYPLIVVLHGAVGQQKTFPDLQDSTSFFFGRWFTRNAPEAGMIAVYPNSTKRYNWMMPDDGFDIVPNIVNQVKEMYPIDDSRVYISGHSNGATGAFSYFMRHPSEFAAFSGVNNRPEVRTGGTFLKNANNRPFFNISTDFDYYYPIEGHREFERVAQSLNVKWQNTEVLGGVTHGYLIATRELRADTIYKKLFKQLGSVTRNPFSQSIYWECDDVRFGRCDWIAIDKVDTLSKPESWQKQTNFMVSGWRKIPEVSVRSDSTSMAFQFPRKSAALKSTYSKNLFEVQASQVSRLKIFISPEMVDVRKPLTVKINGDVVFEGMIDYDRNFMIASFKNSHDSQAIWINQLTFDVPK